MMKEPPKDYDTTPPEKPKPSIHPIALAVLGVVVVIVVSILILIGPPPKN